MSPWAVKLKRVSIIRNGKKILSNIKWVVLAGERWVVFGPNGSGKTSLLKLLCGYFWPTEGRVEVLGHRFGQVNLQKLREKIGWVGPFLQEFIPSNQTPRDILKAGQMGITGRFVGKDLPVNDENIERISRLVGCFDFLDDPYGILSQGEKQRVLLARALISKPKLLILDEPCSGLDVVSREVFLKILERLANSFKELTFVFVTHHLEEIPSFFDKILILKEGQKIASGRIKDVVNEENMSRLFGIPVKIFRENGRFWLHCDLSDFNLEYRF